MLVFEWASNARHHGANAPKRSYMRSLKSAAFIGFLVAVTMICSVHFPKDPKLAQILLVPTFPGVAAAFIFILSSDANIINGVIAVILGWAVNTALYWGIWEVMRVGIMKIKTRRA